MKLIEENHYHLWSDALHARELARQTNNKWDRGTYVRWTIITAWTVLEIACQDALEEENISYSFKHNLDKAIVAKSLPKLNWGSEIWQEVSKIQKLRKNFVHRFIVESDLFPKAELAEETILIVRNAVKEIYQHVGKPIPTWIKDDYDQGWAVNSGFAIEAYGHDSTYANVPGAIKITYVYKDKEIISQILAPGSDPESFVQNLIVNLHRPISAIKVYRGDNLIREERFEISKIRGGERH
jgi:hypothetical protein